MWTAFSQKSGVTLQYYLPIMAIIVQQSLVSVPARAFVERFKFNNSFETVGVSLGLDT